MFSCPSPSSSLSDCSEILTSQVPPLIHLPLPANKMSPDFVQVQEETLQWSQWRSRHGPRWAGWEGGVCVCVWSHLIVESLYQQWWQSALWLGSVRSALQLKPHTVKPPPPVTLTCQMFSFSPRRSPGAQQPLSWWNAAFREERYDVICAHKHHREGAEEMGMWHKKEKQTKQKTLLAFNLLV